MIKEFRGKNFFLSNFFNAPVNYDGINYCNNEAAFQSSKVLDRDKRLKFATLNPSSAKRKGMQVRLRDDWEEVKYSIMKEICLAKFSQNPYLREKLLNTGEEYLEEGNTWGDTTWGVCNGRGKNWLGKILMEVREELR